jgi:hypothetical protein
MTLVRLILLLIVCEIIYVDKPTEFDLKLISFKAVSFITTKEVIVKTFGPGKRTEPNYECGFFSNDNDSGPYYQLTYDNFNYVGSDKDNFSSRMCTSTKRAVSN